MRADGLNPELSDDGQPPLRQISAGLFARPRHEQPAAVKAEMQRPKYLRTMVLFALATLLAWLVVSHSLVLYLADASPKAALWFNRQDPLALINLADRSLNINTPFRAPEQGAPNSDADHSASEVISRDDAVAQNLGPQGDQAKRKVIVGNNANANLANVDATFASVGQYPSVDLSAIRSAAESALRDDPLNPRALRILGQAADAAGNGPEALRFMQAAAQLSLHESIADYWLMRKSTAAGDYRAAIGYADVLLRTTLSLGQHVVPFLAQFADNKSSSDSVKALIKGNPPWRRLFFAYLPQSVSDLRTPLDLLLALKTSATPPTSDEIGSYLTYLIGHGYYGLAYYAWLQLLPADELKHVGLLYNGDFAHAISELPFDWTITQGSGVSIDIVRKSDKSNERALSVDFLYGRVDYHSVNELVVLAPGTYQFEGQYKGELIGPRGLKWRVACAGAPSAPVAESPMIGGVASTWKEMKFTFTIPDGNCWAQYIRLDLDARMASEQLVTGSMLFADLNISRVAEVTGPREPDSDTSDSDESN
jgi:tetratricopeptide (TPR) repeat protein